MLGFCNAHIIRSRGTSTMVLHLCPKIFCAWESMSVLGCLASRPFWIHFLYVECVCSWWVTAAMQQPMPWATVKPMDLLVDVAVSVSYVICVKWITCFNSAPPPHFKRKIHPKLCILPYSSTVTNQVHVHGRYKSTNQLDIECYRMLEISTSVVQHW